jgi:hypothetical protein
MADITPSARFADLHDNEKPELSEMEKASGQLALTESQRSSAGYANSTAGLDHKQEISKAERKLVFKLDILILPLAMLLYLSAYLDRGNLGNAKVGDRSRSTGDYRFVIRLTPCLHLQCKAHGVARRRARRIRYQILPSPVVLLQ